MTRIWHKNVRVETLLWLCIKNIFINSQQALSHHLLMSVTDVYIVNYSFANKLLVIYQSWVQNYFGWSSNELYNAFIIVDVVKPINYYSPLIIS